jgi:hypothetical protein
MRRPDGTQSIFLKHFQRIEIRRYNMSRPDGTFFLNRSGRIKPPVHLSKNE